MYLRNIHIKASLAVLQVLISPNLEFWRNTGILNKWHIVKLIVESGPRALKGITFGGHDNGCAV